MRFAPTIPGGLAAGDDEQMRPPPRAVVRVDDHEVFAAEGAEALRAAGVRAVGPAFCDAFMPGKEGLEAVREPRRGLPGLPVVAVGKQRPGGRTFPAAAAIGDGHRADDCAPNPDNSRTRLQASGRASGRSGARRDRSGPPAGVGPRRAFLSGPPQDPRLGGGAGRPIGGGIVVNPVGRLHPP
jgi:CheY-like chemotaxis protein